MHQSLDTYILDHCDTEDPILHELNRETHLKVLMPRMLSGHLQGKMLEMISKMIRPSHILELGTYTGYSAICLAKGLIDNGLLHTIEINDELESMARSYFKKSGFSDQIVLHIGDSMAIVPRLSPSFDLVFIDADKRQYLDYYQLVFDRVRSGGYIIADNILWDGKVVEPLKPNDAYTKGILTFNDFVKNDSRVEKVIFPVRDGLMVIRKK